MHNNAFILYGTNTARINRVDTTIVYVLWMRKMLRYNL